MLFNWVERGLGAETAKNFKGLMKIFFLPALVSTILFTFFYPAVLLWGLLPIFRIPAIIGFFGCYACWPMTIGYYLLISAMCLWSMHTRTHFLNAREGTRF